MLYYKLTLIKALLLHSYDNCCMAMSDVVYMDSVLLPANVIQIVDHF